MDILFCDHYKVFKHDLKDFFGKRIFFMGSLRPQLTSYPNKQSARQQIKNVHQMRDTFIEYIILSTFITWNTTYYGRGRSFLY